MQVYFFEDATIDKIQIHLASIYDDEENYLNWINKMPNINIVKLDTIDDLEDQLNTGVDLFEEEREYNGTLIDLTKVDLSNEKNILKLFQFIKNNNLNHVFLYSNNLRFSLTPALKKELKALKVKVISLKKIDYDIAHNIALEYRNKINLMLSGEDLKPIIADSNSYIEILDKLDYLKLSDDPKQALRLITPENNPILFMLSFDVERGNYQQWLKLVTKDDYQLTVSLILTKLLKKGNSKQTNIWKRRVIELDKNMKSDSAMEIDNMWKLFLWQYKNNL